MRDIKKVNIIVMPIILIGAFVYCLIMLLLCATIHLTVYISEFIICVRKGIAWKKSKGQNLIK